jgi:hypothetical protein
LVVSVVCASKILTYCASLAPYAGVGMRSVAERTAETTTCIVERC